MSTNINITLAGQLSARASNVQQSTREADKNEKETKEMAGQAKASNTVESEEEEIKVWEPEETRPYYSPVHQDDTLLPIWVLMTEDDSEYKYYIASAVGNNWTLLYEYQKPSPSDGEGSNFFGDNFASIISGNPFNIPPTLWPGDDKPPSHSNYGYWNGRNFSDPTGSSPWNGQWHTPWAYWNHIQHPVYGACSAWVDSLGTAGGYGSDVDRVNFWPGGGLRAFCTRKVAVGSAGDGIAKYLWHGIGDRDHVGGRQKWRHMYKEISVPRATVGYSESAVGLRVFGNLIGGQDTAASKLFGHFYSRRGLGSSNSSFAEAYGYMNFTRTGRNNWTLGWSESEPGSRSIIGQYKQACVDLGLSTNIPPVPDVVISEDPYEAVTWYDAMNLMNDAAGAPGGAPKERLMSSTSGMIEKPGVDYGEHEVKSIKLGLELNNPINPVSDLDPATTALGDTFVRFWVATPKIYNNNLAQKVKNPGWQYYADKRSGVFAISTDDLTDDHQGRINFLDRINEQKSCHFKKHVVGTGYVGGRSTSVSIDTEILQSFILEPERTTIKLVFVTDWGQAATCRQAAATAGLGEQI